MLSVGVRQLKTSLSRYLALVCRGNEVVVTQRGKPIATIRPCGPAQAVDSEAALLAGLAARGLLKLGEGRRRARRGKPPRVDLSAAILAERSERD